MADEPIVPAAPAPAPAAESAPAAPPPVAQSASPELPLAQPVQPEPAPVTPEAPVAEAPKPAETPESEPSLLETELAKIDAAKEKPGDKPEGEKTEAPKPEAEAAPLYDFKPYTLPEGFKPDDASLKSFNDTLIKPDLDPQARGQALIDMHLAEMTKYAELTSKEQWRVFNETRKGWRREVMADPEIGGAGFDTAMRHVATARDLFVPEKDRGQFDQFLRTTGAGDNPAFLRFLNAVGRRWAEPSAPPRGDGYKPPKDIGLPPNTRERRIGSLYDNPISVAKRDAR